MLEKIFKNSRTLSNLRSGVAGSYLEDYTNWLDSKGYSVSTCYSYVYAAVRFLNWLRDNRFNVSEISKSVLSQYKTHLIDTSTASNRTEHRSNSYCGARRFGAFLIEKGQIRDIESCPSDHPLIAAFSAWMTQHRGVTESTLNGYRPVVSVLIQTIGDAAAGYTAKKLRDFVSDQSKDCGNSKAETIITSVRMFVRFLIATGRCSHQLRYAIPPLAKWRLSSLPGYLKENEIEQIIDYCDPSTHIGARDRAVILLLARLGLRASDVAGLRLGDIDWKQGKISVSGKTKRKVQLPLPQEVGDAILYYLKQARPRTDNDAVFIISTAPYTPILPRQISQTAQRSILRAGVDSPSYGAHIFRHSLATSMLRDGMSLQNIGSILRHSSIEMTTHYAKVDIESLRKVALPWLGEVQSC